MTKIPKQLESSARRVRRLARRLLGPINEKRRLRQIRNEISEFNSRPVISVISPVFNVEERWLRKCIESVINQVYPDWELCVADDRSPEPHVRRVLDEYRARDPRIKVVYRDSNGHISEASNSALELATGEFCVLLDHDDELTPDALFEVARIINDNPTIEMIYSDEDKIDERGIRFHPTFKPDFSRDLMYSLNLVTHLIAYRTATLMAVGGFRKGFEGSQDYDLALRVMETIDETQIRHVPRILYHWRAIAGSVALAAGEKSYAHERARRAIAEHLERSGVAAEVLPTRSGYHRVRYGLPDRSPGVDLIAIGGDLDGFAAHYPNLKVLQSGPGARALNETVSKSSGEIVCFVNGLAKPTDPDWLSDLCGFALQPNIGAVGGKIIDEDGIVTFGGMVFGPEETSRIAHRGLRRDEPGYLARLEVVNNVSAVSIDCLAIRRELFESIGGFDETLFPNGLFDADLCLRLAARGFRIVFDPFAELTVPGVPRSVDDPESASEFRRRWKSVIARDPYSNPNFAPSGRPFELY